MPKKPGFEIKINEAALRRAAQPAIDDYEHQANTTLHDTLREVTAEMPDASVEEQYDVVVARLHQRIPGLTIDEPQLRATLKSGQTDDAP